MILILLLAIEPDKQGFFSDIYRNIFWSMAKGTLWFLEGIFKVIDKIWRYRFFDNEYVNKIFGACIIVACSWLILKTILELIMNHIIKSDERSSPLSIYRGVVLAIVMMFLIAPIFQFGHNISSAMTNAVLDVSGFNNVSDVESNISSTIIRAMVYEDQMEEDKIDYLVSNWKKIDINETTGGFAGLGDVYVYSLNFFMLFIISIVMIFLFFFVGIQIAERIMEIALYKIIGPFCCTSLTTNQASSFNVWCKSSMGAFLVTVVQFICIGLLLNLCGQAFNDTGFWASIFLIIGALIFIITTPTIINTLLNQQSGAMSGFGGIQSLMAVSSLSKQMATYPISLGSNVVNGGKQLVNKFLKGSDGISNMFNNSKLTSDQQDIVKENLNNHNSYQAFQQTKDFINQNVKSKKSNNEDIMKYTTANPFKNPYSMKFNPIRNQYINQNNNNDLNDRKWY